MTIKGEMSTKDLETREGKSRIKELFKKQLGLAGRGRSEEAQPQNNEPAQ